MIVRKNTHLMANSSILWFKAIAVWFSLKPAKKLWAWSYFAILCHILIHTHPPLYIPSFLFVSFVKYCELRKKKLTLDILQMIFQTELTSCQDNGWHLYFRFQSGRVWSVSQSKFDFRWIYEYMIFCNTSSKNIAQSSFD